MARSDLSEAERRLIEPRLPNQLWAVVRFGGRRRVILQPYLSDPSR